MTHDFKAAYADAKNGKLSANWFEEYEESLRIMADVQNGRIVLMPRKQTKEMAEAILRHAFIHHDGSVIQYEWWDEVVAAAPEYTPAINKMVCPRCGGPADNGHDRELPPNPYNCTKCEGKEGASFRERVIAELSRTHVVVKNVCPTCGKEGVE